MLSKVILGCCSTSVILKNNVESIKNYKYKRELGLPLI